MSFKERWYLGRDYVEGEVSVSLLMVLTQSGKI